MVWGVLALNVASPADAAVPAVVAELGVALCRPLLLTLPAAVVDGGADVTLVWLVVAAVVAVPVASDEPLVLPALPPELTAVFSFWFSLLFDALLVVLPAELLKLLMRQALDQGVVDEEDVVFDAGDTFDVGIGAEAQDVDVTAVVAVAVVATMLLEEEVVGDDVELLLLLLSLILLVLPDRADSGVVVPLAVCSVGSDDIFNCL